MRKLFFVFLFFSSLAFSSNEIQKAFLVAIISNDGKIENVQHKTSTNNSYTGDIFSKVAIIGNYNKNTNIVVKINHSIGKLIQKEPLYNNINKKIYGYELSFKHLDIKKGYFEIFIDGKLYDTKVFVK